MKSLKKQLINSHYTRCIIEPIQGQYYSKGRLKHQVFKVGTVSLHKEIKSN